MGSGRWRGYRTSRAVAEVGPTSTTGARAVGQFLLAGMYPCDLSVTVDRMTVRCVIVDDSSVFVTTARRLLEQQGLSVLGVASNGAEALRLTAELRPDVLLVDVDLDGESGLDVVTRVAGAAYPPPLMILISTHAEEVYADLVAETVAVGFLSKAELSATAVHRLLEERRDTGRPTEPGER
jgi:chemotaxis response regulator CheB